MIAAMAARTLWFPAKNRIVFRFRRTLGLPNGKTNFKFQEDEHMDKNTPNTSIKCTVTSCAHPCNTENYCALSAIQVGTHEANPAMDQCTDCQSFKKYQ